LIAVTREKENENKLGKEKGKEQVNNNEINIILRNVAKWT